MKTIEDARNHCRYVGEEIEKAVADGEDLFARFEGTPILRSRWSATEAGKPWSAANWAAMIPVSSFPNPA